MKITSLLLVILLVGFAPAVHAQFTGDDEVVTVEEVQDLEDGMPVTLEGYIIKQRDDDSYTFKDDTGEIEVEIDDDIWQGREVGTDTKVQLQGEVDRGFQSISVEVNNLKLVEEEGMPSSPVL